ncbi:hypothetical protein [Paenarthrobacter sp. PH39-S1]|uniref:hypothetical protein n=1 Tax=Paenarthrobacter sp. PH39-S1 TaxID=3046204 RepID=UPI0024BAEAC2|nr:hypothetical protein [Paenarthrobacter sp. PH39-S1]MDJ0356104.1 hypothetical protein [Paenarthrobacter sp. PH39-S1]
MGISLKTTTGKVLASLTLVGVAASVAGLGTYGAFTSSTAASAVVSAGTVGIALGATGTAANRLSIGAAGLVPGDSIQRVATLTNAASNQGLSAITLTAAAAPSSVLDSDPINGLQVTIDKCSVAWAETNVAAAGGAAAYNYTCPTTGTITQVLASRAVVGADVALINLTSLNSGSTDNLRVTMTLPTTAGNGFQGQTSTIGFSFTGTARVGANK